jgi:hypothetical protein
MTTNITFDLPETSDSKIQDQDTFTYAVLKALFRSLAGTWTHDLRAENATTVDLPTVGHGLCSFVPQEATKIKGEDDPAIYVEEMLVHENGEYSIEGSAQAALSIPSLLWNRNFVWRMDVKGSSLTVIRPQVEKRRESSMGRKGSVFRRMSFSKSHSPPQERELAWRRMSTQSGRDKAEQSLEGESRWRRMSIPVIRRKSKAEVPETNKPLREEGERGEGVLHAEQNEESKQTTSEGIGTPRIDIYATKPGTRKMSFHLHTLTFDLQPDLWRQNHVNCEDIRIRARGDHFTGEEKYGTNYEFLMRWKAAMHLANTVFSSGVQLKPSGVLPARTKLLQQSMESLNGRNQWRQYRKLYPPSAFQFQCACDAREQPPPKKTPNLGHHHFPGPFVFRGRLSLRFRGNTWQGDSIQIAIPRESLTHAVNRNRQI